jgi:hypothetical protein
MVRQIAMAFEKCTQEKTFIFSFTYSHYNYVVEAAEEKLGLEKVTPNKFRNRGASQDAISSSPIGSSCHAVGGLASDQSDGTENPVDT